MVNRIFSIAMLTALASGIVIGVPIWMMYIGALIYNNPEFLKPFWTPKLLPHSLVIGLFHGVMTGFLIGIFRNRLAIGVLAGLVGVQLTYYFGIVIWFPTPNDPFYEILLEPYLNLYAWPYLMAVTIWSFLPAVLVGVGTSILVRVLQRKKEN
jgi:hypothetical protein